MNGPDLPSLLIAPDRELAEQFLQTVPAVRAFRILGDLKSYPAEAALGIRLRQLEPAIVLLDVASGPEQAGALIEFVTRERPEIQVIGLGRATDPQTIVGVLRRGASEFLLAPFESAAQEEAVRRLNRLRQPALREAPERDLGTVVCVASAKPGAGASTIALELSLALARGAGVRVLFIDADLAGGVWGDLAADPEPGESSTFADALEGDATWQRRVHRTGSIDLLPAPSSSRDDTPLGAVGEAYDAARRHYDWVVVDLPVVFDRLGLISLSLADHYLLVTAAELPSLHLARRALGLLDSAGFGKSAVKVIVNRVSKRDGLGVADFQKIFSTPVEALIPPDPSSLAKRFASAAPFEALGPGSELGRGIEKLAAQLRAADDKKRRKWIETEPAGVTPS